MKLEKTNKYDRQKKNLIPAECHLLKIKVSEKLYEFLYDTGSQFSVIERSIYDDLPNKPPLHGVTQCDIGNEGSKFVFDAVVYLIWSYKQNKDIHITWNMNQFLSPRKHRLANMI